MSNPVNADDKKIINVRIKRKQEPQQPAGPSALYSKEQVRQFVHEFVSSWIRGDIIIRFPTAAELAKKTPLNIAFPNDPSLTAELKIKEHYIDLLSIVAGIKPASAQDQDKAISEIFKMMLMFRSSNRIEGRILSSDLERRVAKLEETYNNQSKLVDQITGHLFAPKTVAKKGKQRKLES
ncbi:MAG: hypothetical protein ACM3UY_01050 [Methanocella sp.]|jgi:hypothetical protein